MKEDDDDEEDKEGDGTLLTKKPSLWLLFRYIAATSSSRIMLPKFPINMSRGSSSKKEVESSTLASSSSEDTLLNIPPASLYLLEKLGVVTALTLIDDELACDPFSTPQQLLIPSGQGGLKLLDLCPIYEEDENDDDHSNSDEDENIRRNNSSLRDDNISLHSDDSNEETRFNFNHSFSAPRKTIQSIRKYKKKKRLGKGQRDRKDGEEEEIEDLSKLIHESIEKDQGYISAALLARFDANETFPRLPFEPITKKEYLDLQTGVLSRRITNDFGLAMQSFAPGKDEAQGPAACDSDKCLFAEKSPK